MIYNVFALITSIVTMLFCVYILYKGPKKEINRVLALISLLFSLWGFVLFYVKLIENMETVLFLAKLNFVFMTAAA